MIPARRILVVVLTCSALAAVPSVASAATTIGSGPPGSEYQCVWGVPNTATYGQTITVPQRDNVLDSFTFHVTQNRELPSGTPTGPVDIVYKAYVYEWNGSSAVGSPLWESPGPQTLTTTVEAQAVTAETGGVALQSGVQYVLFLSVSETYDSNAPFAGACWMYPEAGMTSTYDGGRWYFINNGDDTTQWTTSRWTGNWVGDVDMAFSASFSGGPDSIYAFDGFYEPVKNRDDAGAFVLNVVQAGQAIPIKFSLGGNHGLDVMADGYPKSAPVACDSQAEVNGIDETVTAGASTLSYAAGSDTYTYVWKTDRAWSDTCRQFVLKLDDGTTARARFMFR